MSALSHDELSQFTGDLERYRHGLNRRVIYTPGVRHLAERAGSYWLIDLIASYYGSTIMKQAISADDRLAWMQFWRLDVRDDRSAVASCRADSGEEPVIAQVIPFTDFQLDHIDVWAGFDGEHWTLYLPSEH
ncbi:MAG: DUF6876 family protein [Phycisphaerales bacterium]